MTEYNDSFQRHMLREMRSQTALLQIAVKFLDAQKKSYEREIHAGGATLRTKKPAKYIGSFEEEVGKGFEQMKQFSKEVAAMVASGALDDPQKPVKPEIKVGQEWKCRDGTTTIISSHLPESEHPWMDHYGRTYTNDGAWSINGKTGRDLIELIKDAPEQKEKTLEQHAQECADKIKQALYDMYKATGCMSTPNVSWSQDDDTVWISRIGIEVDGEE